MRIVEILLPNGTSDRSLSPQAARKIDSLQRRMNHYVDKIMDPSTTPNGKEFLKSRLRDDYYELKKAMPSFHAVAEDAAVEYEVYDRKTGQKVSGPYANRARAARAADKKDLQYGAIRYGYRPVKSSLSEAVTKLPLTNEDFKLVKKLMCRPIPAAIAPIYISEIIEDDELNATLLELEDSDPGRDVRPLIAEWFRRVMPDQMHRFLGTDKTDSQQKGLLSPIHGYDPHFYKGSTDTGTESSGNAYGFY